MVMQHCLLTATTGKGTEEGEEEIEIKINFMFSFLPSAVPNPYRTRTEPIPNRDFKTKVRTEPSCLCTVTPLVY